MSRVERAIRWLAHELREAAPAAAYFFASFQLVAFTDALLLEDYGIRVPTFMLATVAALVAAKVVLILDLMPVANRFAGHPLVLSIAWKTLLFMLVIAAFKYLEHLVPLLHAHRDLAAAHHALVASIQWPRFWALGIWLAVLFAVFAAVRELGRVLGRERLTKILLSPSSRAPD